MFVRYQHIERLGTSEVEEITFGECSVFSKLDGTNASVWLEDGEIKTGSRNRLLSLENDNRGFTRYILEQDNIKRYIEAHPTHRLYGEFLIPHSLRTYRDNAWRKFYIYDVVDESKEAAGGVAYLSYNEYKPLLEEFELLYIPEMAVVKNGSTEQFYKLLEQNNFLIKDGEGIGEGIVIKRYDHINKYGRVTWAKIVTSEFKEKHVKAMGGSKIDGATMIEEKIVDSYCTTALIEKEFAKIENEDGWSSKLIPKLLGTVFYCLVNEECWNFVKENRNPTINFKTLNFFVNKKIKEVKPELF